MSVCIVSFSSRKGGNCGQIADYLCSLHKDAELYDFSDFVIHPCGGCEYECFTPDGRCPWMQDREWELYESLLSSSQCYFQGHPEKVKAYARIPKKFIVVSNTNEQNFKEVLAYHAEGEPQILFLHAKKYAKVSIAGDLMTSEEAAEEINIFAGNRHYFEK